jgi:hypothetical protein
VPGARLTRPTWVDLRAADDYDSRDFDADTGNGALSLAMNLPLLVLCAVLTCAANADDTTREQHQALLDQKARLDCP